MKAFLFKNWSLAREPKGFYFLVNKSSKKGKMIRSSYIYNLPVLQKPVINT